MLSVNPNPAHQFYFFDPMNLGLPGLTPPSPSNLPPTPATATFTIVGSTSSSIDDLSKRIRKSYTITKSREN
ncbi:hypothetical protein SLEP1_g45003 [Rubroshorea leprosula]|uniref:Uncharacterized protein n=1 Tax=Rubroshorea leprosula TaxID=152421 RepID=A0AAV5LHU9_9ROSI|nr:hypothetical protein SLEP1_g45003 [Rubroshorea leprosula]